MSATARTNQSIEKAVALLRHMADHPEDSTIGALARGTGIPRPTASRLLRTLEQTGLLDRDPASDSFAFGYLLARLGRTADPGQTLMRRGSPILRGLADAAGETAHLTLVVDGTTLHTIAHAVTPNIVTTAMERWLGEQRFPLHTTSNGKVLLAHLGPEHARALLPALEARTAHTITTWEQLSEELARIDAVGYAITKDELEVGLSAASVPVHDPGGDLAAIVSLTGPTFRFDTEAIRLGISALHKAAGELELLLV